MRFLDVPEDNSGRNIVVQRYCATGAVRPVLCDQNWLDNVLPSRPIEGPSPSPLNRCYPNRLPGRFTGPEAVGVGVIQKYYLQRVPPIWPFPLRTGLDDFSMQPLRRFRESKRGYGA